MSTSERYPGTVTTDTPAVVLAGSGIHVLIRTMRQRGIDQIERTASNVPCLIRESEGRRVVHPVLGAGGEGYAELAHTSDALKIRGERISGPGHIWDRDWRNGARDMLRVTFSIYHDEGSQERIGTFAHKPESTTWAEVDLALREGLGYAALHAELDVARDDGSRAIRLFGEHADTSSVLEELHFTDSAANILMGQASLALQKGLRAG